MNNPHDFYRDPQVIARILEYCGVSLEKTKEFRYEQHLQGLNQSTIIRQLANQMTAEYLAGVGSWVKEVKHKSSATSRKPEGLGELLDHDLNLFRSVWDRESLVFFLDVEYTSEKYPGEAYANPRRTFELLEPVYQCIYDFFREFEIEPMTIATGQGYHFVFSVDSYCNRDGKHQVTEIANRIAQQGYVESTLAGKYTHIPPGQKRTRRVEIELGKAFDTCGKLLEYSAQQIINRVARYGLKIPIGIGDLSPGNPMQECINLDLSTYADGLDTRVMRTVFSIHDKNRKDKGVCHLPIKISIPRHTPCNGNTLTLNEIFKNREHFEHSANYARAITTSIPECSKGVDRLLESYLRSPLYQFHLDFDRTNHDSPDRWPYTYDRLDLQQLPPCVQGIMENPSPALLQPKQIQTLVRVLTGKQWWHPKHVAGLIRSKYERGHGWPYNFSRYDATTHANTWTRIYTGMLVTGLDQRTDQNCISHQQRGLCPKSFCGYNLADYR